jgi:uncharacterized RDD family membrane protein YckC
MSIELSCTQCGRALRVADDAAGKRARCPACGAVTQIPVAVGARPVPSMSEDSPFTSKSEFKSYAPAKPAPLENPFGDANPLKPKPYGADGVNPFGEYYASPKDTGNPYQAPAAFGYAPPGRSHVRLASRGKRFAGALLDGLFHLLGFIPGAVAAGLFGAAGADEDSATTAFMVFGFGGVLLIAIANWVLISNTGQSFAKRILGMKIVRVDSMQPVGFVNGVALRIWIPQVINQACSLFSLIDALWIFGEEQRCIHDLIASTIVIDV